MLQKKTRTLRIPSLRIREKTSHSKSFAKGMSKAKSEQIQSYEGFGNGSHGTKIYQVSSPCLSCEELIRCSNRRLLSRKSDQILLANYDKDIT